MERMLAILIAILGISILVVVHEAGHYLAARAFGMRVLRFSVGFGPTIAKWQPAGSPTVFQIGAIPFLGQRYVLFGTFLFIIVVLILRPRGLGGLLDEARK